MIAAVLAINKADVRAYISENESLENVMSDRNLCLSFMQSTRSLELGTWNLEQGPGVCDLQKTQSLPTTPPIPAPKRDQNGPERTGKGIQATSHLSTNIISWARQASNNDLVAMWYPQVTGYSPTIGTLATNFLPSLRAALVLFCTSSHHQVRR